MTISKSLQKLSSLQTELRAPVATWAMNKSDWTKTEICEGYFFMVAIDSMMRPIPIPQFNPETEEEHSDWESAKAIRAHMLNQRNDNHSSIRGIEFTASALDFSVLTRSLNAVGMTGLGLM